MSDPITPEEWASDAITRPLDRLHAQWPWLSIKVKGDGGAARIEISAGSVRGQVCLFNTHADGIWAPSSDIGVSGTATGPIVCARQHALELLAVCDACDVAVAMLRGVRVYWP